MAKHNSTQLEAQQSDLNQGIEISSLNGRDFQPSGISISYDSARAAITGKYEYHANDFITFKLIGAASFDGKDPAFTTTTRPVTKDGFADVTFYGMSANPVVHVVLVASLSSDPEVSGTRDFTFMAYPIAAPDQLGCVTVGSGLAITPEGKLSVSAAGGTPYSLPIATATLLGGVKQGTNVSIANDGKLSVAAATTAVAGVVPLASAAEVKAGQDVSKAATAKDIKAVYAPLASPEFSGVVTLDRDQAASGYKVAPKELVTAALLSQSIQGMTTIAVVTPTNGGVILSLTADQVRCPIMRFTGLQGGPSYVRMGAVGRWTIINDCSGGKPLYFQYSASDHPELPIYDGQRVDIIVVNKGAEGTHTYLVTPPVLSPAFTGTATITNDQTKIPPVAQELVTRAYVDVVTKAAAGGAKLATLKQTQDGTDNTTAVTPMDVKAVYAPLASPKLSGCTTITDPRAGAKVLLAMTVDGSYHRVAPTTLDQSSIYLQIGGSEYNANSYRLIGFGYSNSSAKNPPVTIGSVEMDPGGSTKADFIVATRSDTSANPPVERLRVAADGRVTITNDQTKIPPVAQELITKKYLEAIIPKFYEWSGRFASVNPPFFSGSTWILTPTVSVENEIKVSAGSALNVKTGDWFVLGNANFAASFNCTLADNVFYLGIAFPAGNNFSIGPGQSFKFFWSPNKYWIMMGV